MEHLVITQISQHGYLAIFILMVLESACIPIPSEAIMMFGGALAGGVVLAGVQVHLNVVAVALAGVAGNLVGAWIAYAVGRVGGRPLVERFGRYILLRRHELDRAEQFFARHGAPAVAIARILPVARTFISLPAGVAEMPVLPFSVLTVAGSLPWTFGLAIAGDSLAANWKSVESGFGPATIIIAVLIVAAIALWVLHRLRTGGAQAVVSGVALSQPAAKPAAAGPSSEPPLESR